MGEREREAADEKLREGLIRFWDDLPPGLLDYIPPEIEPPPLATPVEQRCACYGLDNDPYCPVHGGESEHG